MENNCKTVIKLDTQCYGILIKGHTIHTRCLKTRVPRSVILLLQVRQQQKRIDEQQQQGTHTDENNSRFSVLVIGEVSGVVSDWYYYTENEH